MYYRPRSCCKSSQSVDPHPLKNDDERPWTFRFLDHQKQRIVMVEAGYEEEGGLHHHGRRLPITELLLSGILHGLTVLLSGMAAVIVSSIVSGR